MSDLIEYVLRDNEVGAEGKCKRYLKAFI